MKLVLQTVLPDGPHWYKGVDELSGSKEGKPATIRGAIWSPYFDDALWFTEAELASIVSESLGGGARGIVVVDAEDSMYSDARLRTRQGFKIRCKYLQVDMICLIGGHNAPFKVAKKTDRLIYFKYADTSHVGSQITRGINSEEWVEVLEKGGRV